MFRHFLVFRYGDRRSDQCVPNWIIIIHYLIKFKTRYCKYWRKKTPMNANKFHQLQKHLCEIRCRAVPSSDKQVQCVISDEIFLLQIPFNQHIFHYEQWYILFFRAVVPFITNRSDDLFFSQTTTKKGWQFHRGKFIEQTKSMLSFDKFKTIPNTLCNVCFDTKMS